MVIYYHALHLLDGAVFQRIRGFLNDMRYINSLFTYLFTYLLYFAQLMYADYVVMLRIKWPCFLPKTVKIRAAFLKLLAEMRGPV